MGDVNLLAIVLAALAFFAIGAVWYSLLFGKAWRRELGITDEIVAAGPQPGDNPTWLIMGLCFLFELLISVVLAHMLASTGTTSGRGIMMVSLGLGVAIMAPVIGINYLFQKRSGKLFAIDAGYMIVGMAAMGGVFLAFS